MEVHDVVDVLRRERLRQGKSLRDVADLSGLSHVAIYRVEDGTSRDPRLSTLIRMAHALRVKVHIALEAPGDSLHRGESPEKKEAAP